MMKCETCESCGKVKMCGSGSDGLMTLLSIISLVSGWIYGNESWYWTALVLAVLSVGKKVMEKVKWGSVMCENCDVDKTKKETRGNRMKSMRG